MLTTTKTSQIRLVSLKKEATLLFLAVFYFLIATNTQTGWLFVLSAFLLGVLVVSWGLSRRAIRGLELAVRMTGEPQRGRPFRLEVRLDNENPRPVFEVKVDSECPAWALDRSRFEWATPKLAAGDSASSTFAMTPEIRGEHQLPPLSIICGAPFGLFAVAKTIQFEGSFLVYPELEKLPLLKSRSRAATALGDVTSPTGRGDTHSLRSVREYKPGDDLRQVHWKASAKQGAGMPLLVREHHAPAPNRILLFLDTSGGSHKTDIHQTFERAVVLAASILWSATRDGTQSGLALRQGDEGWKVLCHWPMQYRALARVKLEADLDFTSWSTQASDVFLQGLPKGFRSCQPCLVKGAVDGQQFDDWPDWISRAFLIQDPDHDLDLPRNPKVVRLNSTGGFHDV
jgi:uncharacterized protein (DUF58 family)